jgi:hypothetical protein
MVEQLRCRLLFCVTQHSVYVTQRSVYATLHSVKRTEYSHRFLVESLCSMH